MEIVHLNDPNRNSAALPSILIYFDEAVVVMIVYRLNIILKPASLIKLCAVRLSKQPFDLWTLAVLLESRGLRNGRFLVLLTWANDAFLDSHLRWCLPMRALSMMNWDNITYQIWLKTIVVLAELRFWPYASDTADFPLKTSKAWTSWAKVMKSFVV